MNIEVTIEVFGHVKLIFSCIAHRTTRLEDRHMDPEFYASLEEGSPVGEHYELEIKTPVWEHNNAALAEYHQNSEGRYFVSFGGHISSIYDAQKVFEIWCLMTTFSLIYETKYCEESYRTNHLGRFRAQMSQRGIKIIRT